MSNETFCVTFVMGGKLIGVVAEGTVQLCQGVRKRLKREPQYRSGVLQMRRKSAIAQTPVLYRNGVIVGAKQSRK